MTQPKIKLAFFGTPDIGVSTLQALIADERFEIVGVGVVPDKPVGRKKTLTPCEVKVAAEKLELPIFEIAHSTDVDSFIDKTNPEIALVIAFGFLFKQKHLDAIPLGMVNVHFSLLPKYRGASPVQSALLDGKTTTGISWQKMVKGLDAGPIIGAKSFDIGPTQTTEDLFVQYSKETAEKTPQILWDYVRGDIVPQDQDSKQATFCGKFIKEDGSIIPSEQGTTEIFNRWRAFQPWPGIYLEDSKIKLLALSLTPQKNSIALTCKDGELLYVDQIQIPGKKPMNALDAFRGNETVLLDFQKVQKAKEPTT